MKTEIMDEVGEHPFKVVEEEESRDKRIQGFAEEGDPKITERNNNNNNNKSSSSNNNNRNNKESSAETSKDNFEVTEVQKPDYVHVRARRGQATDSHSLAERGRREKISERMKLLQDLVPGCNKITGKAGMLDEIINYVQSLQRQVEFLSMKRYTMDNPEIKKLLQDGKESSSTSGRAKWTLLIANLLLECISAIFDQLGYALLGMVMAFIALILSTIDIVHMARKDRITWDGRSLLPCFHRHSAHVTPAGKPSGTVVEYFGLVGAVWQCFYSTMQYAYAHQNKDNPIKMCLLPFIFVVCVVMAKLTSQKAHMND